ALDRLGAAGSHSITVVSVPPGPGPSGDLGGTCSNNADCVSGMCASSGDRQLCTEPCDTSCPDGFACTPAGDSNVCWPSDSGEGGGCNTGAGGGGPALALLGLLFAFAITRRPRA
ncbi:MAG TPA: MYXO-CTERM sorting domain-containing protein, partial [Kofleriaceae bacterium]|nr:MYXO-CTERM sorting domain-containing protein [Kofleriaceae bacterium]